MDIHLEKALSEEENASSVGEEEEEEEEDEQNAHDENGEEISKSNHDRANTNDEFEIVVIILYGVFVVGEYKLCEGSFLLF